MGLKAEREGSLKSIFSSCVSIAIRCLYLSVIIERSLLQCSEEASNIIISLANPLIT